MHVPEWLCLCRTDCRREAMGKLPTPKKHSCPSADTVSLAVPATTAGAKLPCQASSRGPASLRASRATQAEHSVSVPAGIGELRYGKVQSDHDEKRRVERLSADEEVLAG